MHDDEMEPIFGMGPEQFADLEKLAKVMFRRMGLDLPAAEELPATAEVTAAISRAARLLHHAAWCMIGAALLCAAMSAVVLVILLTRSF
jgi:hypothetical protein